MWRLDQVLETWHMQSQTDALQLPGNLILQALKQAKFEPTARTPNKSN
jgi:hypothetical protein